MKRFIIMLLAAVLALLLFGCAEQPAATTGPTVPTDKAVGIAAQSGVYPEPFLLELSAKGEGQIYYTTDGSDPTTSSTAQCYTQPIPITDRKGDANVVSAVETTLFSGNYNAVTMSKDGFYCRLPVPENEDVDKCTVIRAAVKLADGSFTEETAATYFIGTAEEHIQGLAESCAAAGQPLMVISIAMNFEDLFDHETGIYVKGAIFDKALAEYLAKHGRVKEGETARSLDANYKQRGRAWERDAAVTMLEFTPEGAEAVLTQACGIRIQGNYSRSDLQKGFRLFARSEYGENNFDYAVFGKDYVNDTGEVMDKFKTLVLRAGGNCAFTAKFNDTYWQSLLSDTACETKRSRPCVVYLNGEYWGLYVLEEDYTDDYLEDLHGVNKEDVVIYKGDAETYDIGYKLDEGELPEGQDMDYYFRPLLDFFDNHADLRSQADYDAFCRLVDPDSVLDYFAVQCWINNKWDWPGKNWSMWRTTTVDESNPYGDGRWRFMFYDMEFGGVSGKSDAATNTIKEDNYKPHGLLDMGTDNPAVLCFAYLMTNEDFCQRFCDRLEGLSQGELNRETALQRLQEFSDIYSPLYDQFFVRYTGSGSVKNAVSGGYASISCIRDFLQERKNHIHKQIEYCRKILG